MVCATASSGVNAPLSMSSTWAYPIAWPAVESRTRPWCCKVCTSSTSPVANMSCVRCVILGLSQFASARSPSMRVPQRGGAFFGGCEARNGFPVSSMTSSARTVRRGSLSSMVAAACGSFWASSACRASTPMAVSRDSYLARVAGSVGGKRQASISDCT
ncbi:Uncharacterised protein [Chlamydia trachomatis]|nr:Uncharacterised protein [Chlamydia trachomatis]